MSFLVHKNLVNLIFTQNIDGLELKAKIPKEKVVFAHGHLMDGHCSKCHVGIEIELLNNHISEGKVLYCSKTGCKGPCKPKVVFYGEQLPGDFFHKIDQFESSDCGIIMGTSLKVTPFNMLPTYLDNKNAWKIVVNREQVGDSHTFKYNDVTSKDLFIEGVTDDIVKKIIKDLGWTEEFEEYVKKNSS